MEKIFAIACERNRNAILERLQEIFLDISTVLEIGSGTGQHAVHFGQNMPHLKWQTSDLPQNHRSIRAWLREEKLPNVLAPLTLSADDENWEVNSVEAVFSSNTAHIMSWPQVKKMFAKVSQILPINGVFCLYGPFNYDGKYTSKSNAQFDAMLQACEPHQGIRHFEEINSLALKHKLILRNDFAMPANNRLLHWVKVG